MDRRSFLMSLGAGGTLVHLSATAGYAQAVVDGLEPLPATANTMFLTQSEVGFLLAAVDRIIPASDAGPSASESGVVRFIDRALSATYGAGTGQYLQGPFQAGTPQQGYQMPLTPAELYRRGIAEVDAWAAVAHGGSAFADLPGATQDDALGLMENGEMALETVPPAVFFGALLFDTKVGYFADPIHGANNDMAGWRMIGFPGVYSEMTEFLGRTDDLGIEPVSLQSFIGSN